MVCWPIIQQTLDQDVISSNSTIYFVWLVEINRFNRFRSEIFLLLEGHQLLFPLIVIKWKIVLRWKDSHLLHHAILFEIDTVLFTFLSNYSFAVEIDCSFLPCNTIQFYSGNGDQLPLFTSTITLYEENRSQCPSCNYTPIFRGGGGFPRSTDWIWFSNRR